MEFALVFQAVAPILISLLSNTAGALKTDTPVPTIAPVITVSARKASQAIADLQAVLNTVLGLDPPLVVDGWLGSKTEAAIEQAIAKLKSVGIG